MSRYANDVALLSRGLDSVKNHAGTRHKITTLEKMAYMKQEK